MEHVYEIKLPKELSLHNYQEMDRCIERIDNLREQDPSSRVVNMRNVAHRMVAAVFMDRVPPHVIDTLNLDMIEELADFLSLHYKRVEDEELPPPAPVNRAARRQQARR